MGKIEELNLQPSNANDIDIWIIRLEDATKKWSEAARQGNRRAVKEWDNIIGWVDWRLKERGEK